MVVKKKGIAFISSNVFVSVVILNGAGVVWITGFGVGLGVVVVVVESFALYSFSSSFSKFNFDACTCKGIKPKGSWASSRCIFESGIGQVVDSMFVPERVVGFVDISNDFVVIVSNVVVEVCVVDLVVTGAFVVDEIRPTVVDFIGLEVEVVGLDDVLGIPVDCPIVVVGIV